MYIKNTKNYHSQYITSFSNIILNLIKIMHQLESTHHIELIVISELSPNEKRLEISKVTSKAFLISPFIHNI